MEERKWIEQILAGDVQSFSCLIAKYEKMAYTLAFRVMGNKEEAEEVTQDAFIKVYNALDTFKFESKFSTWLYRIVYCTALSALRQQKIFTDYDEARPEDLTEKEMDSAASLLERNDRREIISQVMSLLAPDEAMLLTLFYLEECSMDDIHQITELTISNIKVKLHRGRKHFYEKLQQLMKTEARSLL
ncbi:sigma-70 family RNA polymerase sigma factor [Massilibacteroides sp.]|uniref:RNA polymerase sigma factor n=1 Tax=Massilibacteroides sp. TaxID=2034766 RepID=UPI00262FA721|nr:sigma-70 family RNA polymerase sigma factor [Massilibacteroides sp.]MDD4514173.1 sigma-70 family RNA polymerase sigma factor [Massilibacteroides sp.]